MRRPEGGPAAIQLELLERRRLLAFTVNGSESNNVIDITVAGGQISATVDGVTSTTADAAESSIVVNALGGYDTIRIHSTGDNAVTVHGGSGEDAIVFAEQSGAISSVAAPVYIDGGDGTDTVRFYDWSNTSSGNSHTLNSTTYDSASSAPVGYVRTEIMQVYGSEQADTFVVDGTPIGLMIYVRPNLGADSIYVNRTSADAFVSIDPSNNAPGADSLWIGNGTGSALVHQQSPMSVGSIAISSGGQLKLREGSSTTVSSNGLQLLGNGKVDLTDNALIVGYGAAPSPLATLRGYVLSGRNGGMWNGTSGIVSTTAASDVSRRAVGVIDSAQVFSSYPQQFANARLAQPAVLIRQVTYGDTDLDGKVSLSDFNRLANSFGDGARQWADGDFDYDGTVNLSDFNRLSLNFGTGATRPTPLPITANVLDFGAVPDDGIDDTAAIRAAIESLREGNGEPAGTAQVGGVVYLPEGTFNISGTIRLKSGVKLMGAGHSTVVRDTWNEPTHAAFELYSPFNHQWNIGVSLQDLTIISDHGRGIAVDPNLGGHVVDFRMSTVRLSARGVGIDLRNPFMVHSDLNDVEVFNPGSTAIYTGRTGDGAGFSMRLRNFQVTGQARSGFVAEQGLAMFTGDVNIYGLSISTTGAPVVPLYLHGHVALTDVDIHPAANAPGGVAVLVESAPFVQIERLSSIGVARRLKLLDAHDVQIANLLTDGSSNLLTQLASVDADSYLRVSNSTGGVITPATPAPLPGHYASTPMPAKVVDLREFGAIPSDGLDDSYAIQAAIDSAAQGAGLGATSPELGVIVQFPAGVMHTSVPLRLPSGVWLRGQENASVIENLMPAAYSSRAAVELVSTFAHGHNVGAGVVGLGIHTYHGVAAIKSDASITGELRDLRMGQLRITSGGVGIDFRNVTLSHLDVDGIDFSASPTTAAWFGKPDNSSYENVVRGIRTSKVSPPNYLAEKGLWVFHGGYTIEGASLEDVYPDNPVLPFYGSGSFKITGMYMEFPAQPGNVALRFENCSLVDIDRLYHIDAERQIQFINVADARMAYLNIDGTGALLDETIDLDAASRLTLQTVNGWWDAGLLDHPRVTVKGFYNRRAENFIETAEAMGSPNLVADPQFTSISDQYGAQTPWFIWWGDGISGSLGTYSVETVDGVKRLRIDVPNTVSVGIRVRLNVDGASAGREGIARWRIDGPSQAFVYTREYQYQYQARVMNSMTAARTDRPLAAGDEIWVILHNARGTYYLSQFGMVAD